MSYVESESASASRAARGLAWALVAIGATLLVFFGWFQFTMIQESRSYGLQVSWLSLVPLFLLLGALIGGAAYAARRGKYGMSMALGAVSVAMLGWFTLLIVGGAGM